MCNITDDYANKYEAIIRNAFNCQRYGVAAADADIYRKLLYEYWSLMHNIDDDNVALIKASKKQFDEICSAISGYLLEAVVKLEERDGGFGRIKEDLPQNTIHGINIVIDRILVKNT